MGWSDLKKEEMYQKSKSIEMYAKKLATAIGTWFFAETFEMFSNFLTRTKRGDTFMCWV
jgi:hypothetical protein